MRPNIILICFFISASLYSQEQRTVEIIQAGKSIRNSIEYPDANILQRDKNLRVILVFLINKKIRKGFLKNKVKNS